MNTTPRDEGSTLARALHGQVDGMTESPLTFDDIQSRARTLRRNRRMAVTAGVAAAVAAVALPTAILAGGSLDRSDAPPVVNSPTLPAPVPGELDLTIVGAPTGNAPSVPWIEDGVAHLPDGSTVTLPTSTGGSTVGTSLRWLLPLGDNLLLGSKDDQGRAAITVATREGSVLTEDEAAGRPVLSEDGTVAAYLRPDGTPVLLTGDGQDLVELPKAPAETPYLVAVAGSAPCDGDGDCVAWVNDVGGTAAAYRVDAGGVTEITTTTLVRAVHGDRYLGNISLREDLFPVDGVWTGGGVDPDWTDGALIGFSPDGRWVVRQFSEGLGAAELAVLDAETGKPQVAWLRSKPEGATALGNPVWEDDTHLLQVLTQGRDVVIARFGLDGTLELTGLGQQTDDPTLSTLFLAGG